MSRSKQFSSQSFALTPPIFYILLSLATKERHGYDIMKQVSHDSNGKIKLGPGTLYGAIKRMLDEKLILEIKNLDITTQRRRYYKLTEKGRAIFQTELQRYNDAINIAQQRNLLGKLSISKLVVAYG